MTQAPYGQPPYPQPQPGWVVSPSDGWSAPKGMTPDGRRLAGVGRRLGGLFLDGLIWTLPAMVLYVIAIAVVYTSVPSEGEDPGAGFFVGIVLIYALIFLLAIATVAVEAELIYRRGQTIAMKMLGLRVIDVKSGAGISRGKAWGRTLFARFISGQVCGLGYWWALWDDRTRTLHDLVCGTVVVEDPR